jgi:hypothetical protein
MLDPFAGVLGRIPASSVKAPRELLQLDSSIEKIPSRMVSIIDDARSCSLLFPYFATLFFLISEWQRYVFVVVVD